MYDIRNVFCAEGGIDFFIYGTEGTIEAPISFNEEGTLAYYMKKEESSREITVTAPDNYMLEIEQFGRCITDGENLRSNT